MSSTGGLWNRLISLNGLMLALAVLGALWFLATVTPTAHLSYLGVLASVGLVILLLGFLLFVQHRD